MGLNLAGALSPSTPEIIPIHMVIRTSAPTPSVEAPEASDRPTQTADIAGTQSPHPKNADRYPARMDTEDQVAPRYRFVPGMVVEPKPTGARRSRP